MIRNTKRMGAMAATGVLAMLAAGAGAARAEPVPPPLRLVAAAGAVTAERYLDEGAHSVYLDLGISLIAGNRPLEIRARRTSYESPIVAEQVIGGRRTRLPAGTVTDFAGLRAFTTVTLTNARTGKVARRYRTTFCPNSYESVRTRRDAPAQSPYPRGCSEGNPFLLGAVWGIQAGWNAGIDAGSGFDLAPGKYVATVAVNPAYTRLLKIPAKSATASVRVTVVNVASGPPEESALAADAGGGHDHGEGDEERQISGWLPEFRPPARRPEAATVAPATGPRPDLRSLPAWGISLSRKGRKSYVNFGATVWNAGTSPLLVDGFRRTRSELMDAYQYFYDARGRQVGSAGAGTMEWDDRLGHKHWHFTDFARYELLRADKKLAVRSGKEAFCLANTDAVDYTMAGAKWRPENTDLSTACGGNTAVAVREVLDIGNGDTYTQERPGQSFDVTGLPNGTYYIRVRANPAGKLAELSTANNTSLRRIVLGGTPARRTVTVPKIGGIKG
ncbi:lysyl oxidase family protein [Actinoplanes sp. NPDC051851]|uniref:lysyl oxidase family protein n=1 Tax=Actinoplanes sp. NPDC051851 TaxID=3154753 RepID=UPI003449F587